MRTPEKHQYGDLRAAYDISPSFVFVGPLIEFYGAGSITIGPGGHINRLSVIQAWEGQSVTIGAGVHIGPNVRIMTRSLVADQDLRSATLRYRRGNVIINEYVWIGANVVIMPGVTIGENSVIAANAVVTRDVPAWCIAGGLPAEVIKWKTDNPS